MYLTTKSGKRIIDHNTHLPIFSKPVDMRIKQIRNELYAGMNKSEAKWLAIKSEIAFKQY